MEETKEIVKNTIRSLSTDQILEQKTWRKGNSLYINGQSLLLSRSKHTFEFEIDDDYNDFLVKINVNTDLHHSCTCKTSELCEHKIAAILHLNEDLLKMEKVASSEGKAYSEEGMKKRVLAERLQKIKNANYKIKYASNPYGSHSLINEKGITYDICIRDFEKTTGYCSCPDYATNKLATCKHLMFAFEKMKAEGRFKSNEAPYPFVEIFTDPLNSYRITYQCPELVNPQIRDLLQQYFGEKRYLDEVDNFNGFVNEAWAFKEILIRPDVYEKLEKANNAKILEHVKSNTEIDFSQINISLFPYQKEGIAFAVFKDGCIIADEMGLGKTVQAIATAIFKKQFFGFDRVLVICPASLKEQWKNEIERFTSEKAIVVQGPAEERKLIYQTAKEYFLIANYESVLRDVDIINKYNPDFLILDEAQKVKNYETQTSHAIGLLQRKHTLVITGTPLENKLIDLYTVVRYIDRQFLSPLWEFSYQHCYFDPQLKNKITGYYNLSNLKERLKSILIRREKSEVMEQLPNINHIDVPIEMHPRQQEYHASFAHGIARILGKKFITPIDMQRLMLLLSKMRMVCDSTYLIDLETNFSPKLQELEFILNEKLDLKNSQRKIIIFSEWKKMNHIIGKMLRDNDIPFVELNGSIAVKKRGGLIKEFSENPDVKVFLSTEAGGVGLNLQAADTVINFELPWNPAKKNQRIGRIDRLGQKKDQLTVINFITKDSIEMKIASGLVLKQNLFNSLLSPDNTSDIVDFSTKGKAQFLNQLQESLDAFMLDQTEENDPFEGKEQTTTTENKQQEKEQEEIVDGENQDQKTPAGEAKEKTSKKESDLDDVIQEENVAENLEGVLNQGLGFISGIFKMATGKELATSGESIKVDKNTGEVTMKFKLPGF
jgi:SNF2-related domain/Helicase conserved C-terminal domain/SWIM zinc finger